MPPVGEVREVAETGDEPGVSDVASPVVEVDGRPEAGGPSAGAVDRLGEVVGGCVAGVVGVGHDVDLQAGEVAGPLGGAGGAGEPARIGRLSPDAADAFSSARLKRPRPQ